MPKKIKEFFLQDVMGTAGFESSEVEFLSAASDISELEITDELVRKYHANMLSREAAMNDSELSGKFKKNHWGEFHTLIDNRLKKLNDLLTEEQQITVKEIKSTPDKLEKVIEFIKAKKPAKDESQIQKDYNLLLTKQSTLQSDYERDILLLKESHTNELSDKDNKFKDFQISNIVKSEINNFSLIDNIPGGKNYLADSIVNNLKNSPKFVLELSDSNTSLVDLKQKDDPTKKYFENNKPVELKQVLEPELKDFIKNSPGPSQRNSDTPPLASDKPLTFQQVQAAKAKQNIVDAVANVKG